MGEKKEKETVLGDSSSILRPFVAPLRSSVAGLFAALKWAQIVPLAANGHHQSQKKKPSRILGSSLGDSPSLFGWLWLALFEDCDFGAKSRPLKENKCNNLRATSGKCFKCALSC